MSKKEIIIDGNDFNDMEGFYNEIDNVLTKDLSWNTGHNLNAFNDLLWGGFGVHDYEEQITIVWNNSEKSRIDLRSKTFLNDNNQIETLFDIIVDIIKSHEHIDLVLQ